ncbi:FecR family protein [Rubrolithibacter danxiaensis]|uniref:FecR family protein n=1 Tax=Rubrolithibacter danxiaensis TaxID=3390805 RepID=UPI003BF7EAC5
MTIEEFLTLYEKYVAGKCSPAEEKLINSYRDEMELSDEEWLNELGDRQEIHDSIWSRLSESRRVEIPVKRRTNLWWKAAAVILITLSSSLWIAKFYSHKQQKESLAKDTPAKIQAGGNKAYLTLADGSRIELNTVENGNLKVKDEITIRKTKNGLLVYQYNKNESSVHAAVTEYNTITTPRGGQYQVILEDGSKVWLNAASSIRFPVVFTGREREVEITGEAYFEVAKNKEHPFIVNANGTQVQVLGTHFNVSAYADDDAVTTTLLEGAVRMVKGKKFAMLKPGEQGVSVHNSNEITLSAADIEETMAWKNGFFTFHNENIVNIMKKVSRWYDVDVEYRGDVKDREFGGTVSKYKEITELLQNMQLTGAIHYKMEGRRLIIMK